MKKKTTTKKRTGPRPGTKPNNMKDTSQNRFLSFLSAGNSAGNIIASARCAHVPPSRIARWRREDPLFEAEVQKAKQQGDEYKLGKFEEVADQRAVEGRQRPIYGFDKSVGRSRQVGVENIPSDRLLEIRLKRLDPGYRESAKIDIKTNVQQNTLVNHNQVKARLTDEQQRVIYEVMEQIQCEAMPEPKMLSEPKGTDFLKDSVLVKREAAKVIDVTPKPVVGSDEETIDMKDFAERKLVKETTKEIPEKTEEASFKKSCRCGFVFFDKSDYDSHQPDCYESGTETPQILEIKTFMR